MEKHLSKYPKIIAYTSIIEFTGEITEHVLDLKKESQDDFENSILDKLDESTVESYAERTLDMINENDAPDCIRDHIDDLDDADLLKLYFDTKNIVFKSQIERVFHLLHNIPTSQVEDLILIIEKYSPQ